MKELKSVNDYFVKIFASDKLKAERQSTSKCSLCLDTRIFDAHPCPACCTEEYNQLLKEEEIKRIEGENVKEYGIHFADKNLDNFKAHTSSLKKAKSAVENYLKNLKENLIAGRGLTLIGPTDTGKSHLMVGLKRAAQAQGFQIAICNVMDILIDCRRALHDNQLDEYELLRKYIDVPYLILDDFGVELNTRPGADNSWVGRLLYYLVHKRWIDLKPLFITTNYDLERLQILLGDNGPRIVSRLLRMNGPAISIDAKPFSIGGFDAEKASR